MNIEEWEQLELERKVEILPQKLKKSGNINKEKMNIVYIMVWTRVCGGSKIILEYANRLVENGHDIAIVTYDNKPTWYTISDKITFIQVPEGEELKKYIPKCDIIVATSWKCIYTAVESNKAPVTFFEQGGSHLFETEKLSENKIKVVNERMQIVPFIYTVSEYSKDKIKELYGKDAQVIYNALDSEIFYPRKAKKERNKKTSITIIGSEDFKFKNIGEILQTVRRLNKKYNIKLNWITQTKPQINKEEAIINPEQKVIGEILRNTDIYICNSEYESFGLPTLEAMTCGAAVITTDTGGMRDFVQDGKNALVIKKHDTEDMEAKIELLLNNYEMLENISKEGIKTAERFQWENSIKEVENYYRMISRYKTIDGVDNKKERKKDSEDAR